MPITIIDWHNINVDTEDIIAQTERSRRKVEESFGWGVVVRAIPGPIYWLKLGRRYTPGLVTDVGVFRGSSPDVTASGLERRADRSWLATPRQVRVRVQLLGLEARRVSWSSADARYRGHRGRICQRPCHRRHYYSGRGDDGSPGLDDCNQ